MHDPITRQDETPETRHPRLLLLVLVVLLLAAPRGAAGTSFGFETAFGDEQNNVWQKQIATQVTLAQDGDLESMSAYVKGPPPTKLRFAIYEDSGGEPGDLIVETAAEAVTSNSYYWHTINTPTTALTAGTYWLALAFEHQREYYTYNDGAGQTRHNGTDAVANGFDASWGASTSTYTRQISIYGTLAGGAAVLGHDSIGGSTQSGVQARQIGTQVTMPEPGTVTSITAYVGGKQNMKVACGLYTDVGGEPGALLAESATETTPATPGWLEIDLPDTWIPAGTYWLALSVHHADQAYAYEPVGGRTRENANNATALGFIDPWGASDVSSTRLVSIYGTYTPGGAPLVFTDVSSATGFDVQTTSSESSGSGLHWGDLDDDGDLDAIVTGSPSRRLTSNSEGASFFVASFGGGAADRQGALLDIDNDGDLDFWHQAETLWENDGLGVLTNAGNLGLGDPTNNEGVAAADVDGDGACDVVMCSENGNWIGHHERRTPVTLVGSADVADGLNDVGDAGNGDYVSSGDVDDDGDLDFFYHFGGGKLFVSDGDGTYTESPSGISVVTGNSDKFGSAWGDYDNDGDLDLFTPRYDSGSPGYLWRNDGGTFANVAVAAGIADTSGQRSACWGDYDNDGDLDLYVVTRGGAANVLYRNAGGVFTAMSVGADAPGDGHDAVFVDYDNDGDLDLAVTRQSATNVLLRNDTDTDEYLKVRVIGWGAWGTNKAGVGVKVELYDGTATTLLARRDVLTARGYGGTEPPWLHFGGVAPASTYVVRVHFRTGAVDVPVVPRNVSTTIGTVTIPQMLTVVEPQPQIQVIQWQEVDPAP